MHKKLFKDIISENFDFKELELSDDEINSELKKISESKEEFEEKIANSYKGKKYLNSSFSAYYFGKVEYSESFILSFLLANGLINKIFKDLKDDYFLSNFRYFLHEKIIEILSTYEEASDICAKIISNIKDPNVSHIKSFLIESHYMSYSAKMELFNELCLLDINKVFSLSSILSLIDLSGIKEIKRLIEYRQQDVRLACYRKIGYRECLDLMISDDSYKIRAIAAENMDFGDRRFEKFLEETSKGVISVVLKRCKKELLPLFMANKLVISDKNIESILKSRF